MADDSLRGARLVERLVALPPSERDPAVERWLGLGSASTEPPGPELIGHHTSGLAAIVEMALTVPLAPDDVFVDLGSGLGKVVLLVHLLTGIRARGIELQPSLVEQARSSAHALGAEVSFAHADARHADLSDGTVFFLYLPFTGSALEQALERLHAIARQRAIVVCTLGLDLHASWLSRRPSDHFWLNIYDSQEPGVSTRAITAPALLHADAQRVSNERA